MLRVHFRPRVPTTAALLISTETRSRLVLFVREHSREIVPFMMIFMTSRDP